MIKDAITGKSQVFIEEEKLRIQSKRLKLREERIRKNKRIRRKQRITLIFMLLLIIIGIYIITILIRDKKEEINKTSTVTVKKENSLDKYKFTRKDYIYNCDTAILKVLEKKAKTDKTIEFIYKNYKAYPEFILKSLSNNSELRDFVIKYPFEIKKEISNFTFESGEFKKGVVPHFLQWDDRWGYYPYGDDVIGISGCGPTCLSMAVVALTGKSQYSPIAMADFATENGYYYKNAGTTWDLFNKGVYKLGLKVRTVGLSEQSMAAAVKAGEYLILSMGPGVFTTQGHYILIYGYEDGKFLIKDPNSVIRTDTKFKFESFKDQIKNIWAISK